MTNHIYRWFVISTVCLFFNNCAMRPLHNKSIVDLRNEAAENYSKQVVEAAVGIIDRSELPVMFSVEGGNSVWNPKYESQFGASIAPPWSADKTALNPGILVSETVVDSVQFNDFGSAATYRLNILYTFLCFPYDIESLHLPNGVIYSLFVVQDNTEGLNYPIHLSDGKYLGVPKEKRVEFLLFVNDVMNWSRHATPNLLDLSSPPGIVYMFLFKFYDNIQVIYSSNQAVTGLSKETQQLETQLQTVTTDYQTKLKQALGNPSVNEGYTATLSLLRSDVQAMQSVLNDLKSNLGAAQSMGQTAYSENLFILNKLHRALTETAKYDPDVSEDAVQATIDTLTKQVKDVHEGKSDIQSLRDFIPVGGSGINANESTEDIYRERFERLPDSIDASVIRLN